MDAKPYHGYVEFGSVCLQRRLGHDMEQTEPKEILRAFPAKLRSKLR